MASHADVVICGGGLVGGALALALQDSGLSVALLEAQADFGHRDARTLAISYASRLVLERLGVWQDSLQAVPIERIHVSHRHRFGQTSMTAEEMRLPALGYVIRHAALGQVMHEALDRAPITYLTGAQVERTAVTNSFGLACYVRQRRQEEVTGRLLVLADGGRMAAQMPLIQRRVQTYGQAAVVAEVQTGKPVGHVAYERFTPDGPVALLPAGEAYALIWTAQPAQAELLCGLPEDQFLARLQAHFGDRAGTFTHVSARAQFPLTLQSADETAVPRCVLIGNAAQTLHPVAGQGFNLGLRDAWELGQALRSTPAAQVGSAAMLAQYRQRRRADRRGSIMTTDTLIRIFSNEHPLLELGRGLGLMLLETLPPARRLFARGMIYGHGGGV
jgi:2-octaprenyl-6-methoxyphenol hydroxylase